MSNRSRTEGTGQGPVLVVHPSADLYGADRMLLESVRQLVAVHHDVVVALPGTGPLVPLLLAEGARVLEVPSLVLEKRFLRPRTWPELLRRSAVGAAATVRTLRAVGPRAVYVNTEALPLWPVLARCAGARVVVHVHEAELEMPGLVRLGLALPVLPAHRVVVNSEFTLSVLAGSVPLLARKSSVVLNGVAGPPAAPRPARERLDGPMRIVYVGRISERKGVHLLVEVVRQLEQRGVDTVLHVVGDAAPGSEWLEKLMRGAAEEAGVAARVRFQGFHADVWPWLGVADVVVVPAVKAEPFGNTAVEAVLAARPVVVADHTGLREAVRDYVCAELADTLAPDATCRLTEALLRVREDWAHLRTEAVADAEVARMRHDPVVFGRRVAQAVAAPPAGRYRGADLPGAPERRRAVVPVRKGQEA